MQKRSKIFTSIYFINEEEFIKELLKRLRNELEDLDLNFQRLPKWLSAAKVRYGWTQKQTLIMIFEDNQGDDVFDFVGNVDTDFVILLNTENYRTKKCFHSAPDNQRGLTMIGKVNEDGGTLLNFVGKDLAFFDVGYRNTYHGPITIHNMFLQRSLDKNSGPFVNRFIPLALWFHKKDLESLDRLNKKVKDLVSHFSRVHKKELGDYYESKTQAINTFEVTKRKSVIVLGKDTGEELNELHVIKDYLNSKGYDAKLIKELPEMPMMSNEEKVRYWTLASRFCVMFDKSPSGHISEYNILKSQRSILSMLRNPNSGSTYMIGDDTYVDVNYIKVFEFDISNLSTLDEVIEWSERIAQQRIDAYNSNYPWRD